MSDWVYVGVIIAAILLPMFIAAMDIDDHDDLPQSSMNP